MPPAATGPELPAGPPRKVAAAVWLMVVTAALGVLSAVASLATVDTMRATIASQNPTLGNQALDAAVFAAVATGLAITAVLTAVYLVLAVQVHRGRSWARVATLVLSGLMILGAAASLAQPATVLGRVLALLGVVADLGVIVLLTGRESRGYFHRRSDASAPGRPA